ncbi:protein RGF1 INDUCIBLE TRANSCRIPTION FACTOR 1-like [Wolffia australiana]
MVKQIIRSDTEDRRPPWLLPLLKASFFVPCVVHGDGSKGECNMYCLDCTGDALCSYCLADHKDHRIVQIRRSSYHNVIRVSEVSRFLDISCVQTYVINSAKIVFLNERPQQRCGKGVANTCEICGRSLPDAFRFCSLGCKLGGMKNDQRLSFTLKAKPARENAAESDSDDSSSPAKLRKTSRWLHVSSFAGGAAAAPAAPPFISYRTFSRKGTPHRAPF